MTTVANPFASRSQSEQSGTGGMFVVALLMLAPVPIVFVLVGFDRAVVLAMAGYTVFIVVSLALSWALEKRYGTISR